MCKRLPKTYGDPVWEVGDNSGGIDDALWICRTGRGGCENQLIIGMVGKTTGRGELQVEMYDHKAFIPTNMGV